MAAVTYTNFEAFATGIKLGRCTARRLGWPNTISHLEYEAPFNGVVTFLGQKRHRITPGRFVLVLRDGTKMPYELEDEDLNTTDWSLVKSNIYVMDAIANVDGGNTGTPTYANAAAVIAALPTEVTANIGTITIPVTGWLDTDTYDPTDDGAYTFTAVLGAMPANVENPNRMTITVEVVVAPVEITAFDAIDNVAGGAVGSATYADAAAVIAALATHAHANTNTIEVPVTTWVDTDTYNPGVAGSYTFTATLGALPKGVSNPDNHTATVEVVITAA